MADQTLSVLRSDVWPMFSRRLDEAARQTFSTAARDVLARPLELLALMAQDAPAALGDDALAAERLRMLLYLAAPFQTLVDEARILNETVREAPGSYDPGVLDHGALSLLGLAAMRVAPPGAQETFVRTVHGLALSAAPAEALARLVPKLPEAAALGVILETLYLLDTVGAALKAPLLRRFANDAAERARWKCLSGLFERDLRAAMAAALSRAHLPEAKPPPWDGAVSSEIEDVQPQRASPGEAVLVTGRFAATLAPSVRVVFAAPDGRPLPAKVISFDGKAKPCELRVEVPAGAQAGWIGFSDDRLLHASNELRTALRAVLPEVLQRHGCVRGTEVPAHLLPLLGTPDPERPGKLLAVPPRTAGARFAGPKDPAANALVSSAAIPAAAARAPHIAAIQVSQAGRKHPLFSHQPLDVLVLLDAPADPKLVELALDPAPKPLALLQTQTAEPGQRFAFTVPAEVALDGLLITALLGGSESRSLGPISFVGPRQLRLVVVLPQIVEPPLPAIEAAVLDKIAVWLERELGMTIALVQVPFVDDELAVLATPLADGDDARVPALLAALSRRAMLTPHLEDAVWLLLVPEPPLYRTSPDDDDELSRARTIGLRALLSRAVAGGRGFYRQLPAEAARAVAVAGPLGLPALFGELFAIDARIPPRSAPTPRLRLLGTLSDDEIRLEPSKEEVRAAGPGAPFDSGRVVVALDRSGREVHFGKLSCLSLARPAQIAALVPISKEVCAVEIRHGHRRLARVDRTLGSGELQAATLEVSHGDERQSLHWRFRHSQNARPDLSLALGWGRLATEVLNLDACDANSKVVLSRYHSAERLTLLASDGWNLVERPVSLDDGEVVAIRNPTPVLIRRLPDGSFFADVPEGWSIGWSIDGGALPAHSRVLRLPDSARGTLQLRASAAKDSPVVIDERPVEAQP